MNEGSDDKRWWDIISVGCPRDVEPDEWSDTLSAVLAKLPPDDIVRFDRWMNQQANRSNHRDLWQAANLIIGGASEDGFYYFRLWLLGMGRAVFEAAIENPDSLADVVGPDDMDCDAETILTAPSDAWFEATGKDPDAKPDEYSLACEAVKEPEYMPLQGEEWPSDCDEEYRRRFPRLSAIYLSTDEPE